jgi:hypothetical protein
LAGGFLERYPLISFSLLAEAFLSGLRSVWWTLDLEVVVPDFLLSTRDICVVLVLLMFMAYLRNLPDAING